jgi:coenzyme F420 hydrogenase subunit beta
MPTDPATASTSAPAPARTQWRHLFEEVVTTGLCTGCGACVVACAFDRLEYDDAAFLPRHAGEGGPGRCERGDLRCGVCTRACPRFRDAGERIERARFGRLRRDDEPFGIVDEIVFARALDPAVRNRGQDGGAVSALLAWGLRTGQIDGAVTAGRSEGRPWDAAAALLTTEDEVLGAAGSRYTYAPAPLALGEAVDGGLVRVALVGTSCQASVTGAFQVGRLAKWHRRIAWTFGLLCSKTFTYEGLMQGWVHRDLGIAWDDIAKVNIKGKIIVTRSDGEESTISLREARAWTRAGCERCTDFAAEDADVSFGGIGATDGWTLTIVRTPLGRRILAGAVRDGVVETRPAAEDPAALALLAKMSQAQRGRAEPTQTVAEERGGGAAALTRG